MNVSSFWQLILPWRTIAMDDITHWDVSWAGELNRRAELQYTSQVPAFLPGQRSWEAVTSRNRTKQCDRALEAVGRATVGQRNNHSSGVKANIFSCHRVSIVLNVFQHDYTCFQFKMKIQTSLQITTGHLKINSMSLFFLAAPAWTLQYFRNFRYITVFWERPSTSEFLGQLWRKNVTGNKS